MFKLANAFPARGKALSVYLPPHLLELVQPWAGGRMRSARLAVLLDRYRAVAACQPDLSTQEWTVLVQLVGPFATTGDVSTAWARLLDGLEEGRSPPGVDAAALTTKLRELSLPEKVAVLEVADRAALGTGSWRERLAVVRTRKRP